jgi:predicted CxxxxCH...CXXCH cytochrome family protein
VPTTQASPGHIDGDSVAEVTFGVLDPIGAYSGTTCSNLYCHGNGRGGNGTRDWLSTTAEQCGTCHRVDGQNMSGKHARHAQRGVTCNECHGTVVDGAMSIVTANLHINGVHEVKTAQGTWNPNTRQCANVGCHNTRSW